MVFRYCQCLFSRGQIMKPRPGLFSLGVKFRRDPSSPRLLIYSYAMPGCKFYIRVLCGRFQLEQALIEEVCMEDLRKSVCSLNLKVGFEEKGSESVLPRPFAQSPTCMLWQILWILSFCVNRSEGKWGHVNLFNGLTNHLMFAFSTANERDLEME